MVHPTRGERKPVFDYDDVRDAAKERDQAERLRLYYVAMTRAIDRLIVSGAIDPERAADRETPIGWVLERLAAHDVVGAVAGTPTEIERGDSRFLLTVDRYAVNEQQASEEVAVFGQLPLFDELPSVATRHGIQLPALAEIADPPLHNVRRLSYSALAQFERCSYRYFAERVLGLGPRTRDAADGGGEQGLAATELGDAVHRLLEHVPLDHPVPPSRPDLDTTVRGWYPEVTAAELDRISDMVDAYCASELAQRIAGLPGARPERPFVFEHDGVLLHGRLDVLWRDGQKALVVDYKSNALEGAAPASVVDAEYRLQRLVYALACLRDGATEAEIVYQFLERPDDVVAATFSSEDTAELEAELSAAIGRIREGEFKPTPSEFACADCPALDLICAGPRLPAAR
jgi:ATP-dependent exoDNAse (exonuclease V) beta subunit